MSVGVGVDVNGGPEVVGEFVNVGVGVQAAPIVGVCVVVGVGVLVTVAVTVGVGDGHNPISITTNESTPPVLTTLFFLAHK